ncbi:MAG: hypothetical protein AAB451_02620 [Patescibacteria group bacterium]
MSHISRQTVKGFDTVHPAVLGEGIKVAAQLLALQGAQVTDFVYNWSGEKVRQYDGVKIICAIATEGAVNEHKFGGVGIGIDASGKLAIVGDFYYDDQKKRAAELKKQLEQVLGGSCYFAARALIAQAKGQKTEIRVTEARQLQLVVQM